jgi:hypothetical protein
MSERNVHDPQDPGSELPVEGAVDTLGGTGSTPGSRPTSIHLFPFLASGVELATGFFNRLQTMYVGTVDGKRVGQLVVAAGSALTNLLTAIATGTEDIEDMLQALLSRLDAVKVPVDRLSILSLAYNYAAQALQTIAVVGDPPRINGPATFWSVTAANVGNGTTQYIIPCAMYARQGIQIYFTNAGATLLQFRSYAKVDDIAWPAAGAIPAQYSIDNLWQYPAAGLVFGAPPIGGAGVYNALIARMQDPTPWNSIAIEVIASASAGNTTGVGTYTLQGGTK